MGIYVMYYILLPEIQYFMKWLIITKKKGGDCNIIEHRKVDIIK